MIDYLIQTTPDDHHRLSISWSEDRSLIFLTTNSRTISLLPAMADEILKGLLAILRGNFDRAISETELRLLQEEETWRANRAAASRPSDETPRKSPALYQL